MILLIDEVIRGRARLPGSAAFFNHPDLRGLAGTVLTAVAVAAGPPTVPQIGRSLGYPRQTIQRQADLLVEVGLADFIDNPDHKRAKRLVATPAGAELYREVSDRSRRWAARFAADIAPEDLATTVRTLRAIRHKLETEARDAERPLAANE